MRRVSEQYDSTEQSNLLKFDDLSIDVEMREVTLYGDDILLTSTKYDLLVILAKRAGDILSRHEIMQQLSGGGMMD
jgi:two-component system OmpR family response regulator